MGKLWMCSFATLEIGQNLSDEPLVRLQQARPAQVKQQEAQALGAAQLVLADLVQAGEVFDDAAPEKRPPPEIAGRAVDEEQPRLVVDCPSGDLDRKSTRLNSSHT